MKRILVTGFLILFSFAASATTPFGLPDFTGLVKENRGAVVNISATTEAKTQIIQPQLPDIFRHFFGDQVPFEFAIPQPHGNSLGSGFIISEDGYLLSNRHVVDGTDKIIVRLNDRREFVAEVVGTDERSDIALLKIDGEDLPTVELGSSDELEVGEWVLAIGSPFGFDYSVTSGIVSAKGRPLPNENYVPFIQTDVAINPGNSGGPLFNMDGEVVGINSQIYSRTGGFMGLSFAIPIEIALEVVEQLKETGHVTRGWLGVLIQEVNHDLAESFGLDKPAGALISRVYPDSPAEEAGLKPGDVVISYNGKPVNISAELPHLVGRTKVGEKAKLGIMRNGKKKTITLTIAALPESGRELASGAPEKKSPGGSMAGVTVRSLTSEEKARADLQSGVRVVTVQPGPLASAGVQPGDVITMLNNEPVKTEHGFHQLFSQLEPGTWVPMQVYRRGTPSFLPVFIPKQ